MVDRSHIEIARFVDDLLEDPMTRMVMEADDVDRDEMRELLFRASLASYPGGVAPANMADLAAADYRPSVGILVFNARGEVLVCRRVDVKDAWQMPQGGIGPGETAREAALRELREEIGTDKVEIVGEAGERLRYDLPAHLIGSVWGGAWRGQSQQWFAAKFLGSDAEIDVQTDHPEFDSWKWVAIEDLPKIIVAFKRDVYHKVVSLFNVPSY